MAQCSPNATGRLTLRVDCGVQCVATPEIRHLYGVISHVDGSYSARLDVHETRRVDVPLTQGDWKSARFMRSGTRNCPRCRSGVVH